MIQTKPIYTCIRPVHILSRVSLIKFTSKLVDSGSSPVFQNKMFALRRRPTHLTRGAIAKSSPFANHRCFTAAVATQAPASSYNTLLRKPIEGSKSVVVTGSARGIGKSIALRLALDGYNVCINDIGANEKACEEVVKEIQSIGRKACTATADVSKAGEVRDMIQKSVRQLGPLHTMYVFFLILQLQTTRWNLTTLAFASPGSPTRASSKSNPSSTSPRKTSIASSQ